MQVADEFEVFSMLDGDALEAAVRKHNPDIIVPEIEAIRTERLYDFEKQGIHVVPSARAVNYTMNRKAIRDLAAKELGLKTAKYFYAKTFEELEGAANKVGFPCVIKPLMSSSGKGQSVAKTPEDLKHSWEYGCSGSRGDIREFIVEEFINFDIEITLLTVTQQNGPTLFCPPIAHVQKSGDYRESYRDAMGINPEDYITLTSFTHHPFYTWFPIEVCDNWRWDQAYNIPIDEFMAVLDNALENGYTAAWGADVSHPGFTRTGTALLVDNTVKSTAGSDQEHWVGKEEGKPAPAPAVVEIVPTQESRQADWDNKTMTDDHGMQIYGIAKDQNGKKFYMVKNSSKKLAS